jgi:hypothetical protein
MIERVVENDSCLKEKQQKRRGQDGGGREKILSCMPTPRKQKAEGSEVQVE